MVRFNRVCEFNHVFGEFNHVSGEFNACVVSIIRSGEFNRRMRV
jgi:hypothetical protein